MRPTRHPVLVPLLVAVLALLAGCGGGGVSALPVAEPPTTSPTPTDPPVAVTGLDQSEVDVTDTTGTSPGPDLSFASPIYSVATVSDLTGPTPVRLRLDYALPRTSPVFVVTRREPTDPWTYLPARLTGDLRHVEFTAARTAEFAALVMDLPSALQSFRTGIGRGVGFSLDRSVKKPECQQGAEARKDGYRVVSSKGRKTVFWCLGLENDKRVLRVTNRREQPVQLTHPDATLVTAPVPAKAWLPWSAVQGDKVTLLAPGRTATFDAELEPTKRFLVSAASDAKAQSLRLLQATTAALVVRANQLGAGHYRPIPVLASLVARPQCARTLGLDSARMLAGCFSRRKLVATFGSEGLVLTRLVSARPVSLTLRQHSRAVARDVAQHGNENILVWRTKPDFTDFVGTYTAEARTMSVDAEGLVFESVSNVVALPVDPTLATDVTGKGKNKNKGKNKGKTPPATTTQRVADVTYQLSEPRTENGVSTAQAVVTKVRIYDRKAFHDAVPRVGDTGVFRLEKGVVRSPFVKRLYCGSGAKQNACG